MISSGGKLVLTTHFMRQKALKRQFYGETGRTILRRFP